MAQTPGPGPLAVVHRITIATAFGGAIAYAAFEAHRLVTTGEPSAAVALGAAVLGTVAIGLYLRNLRSRLEQKLTPTGSRR